MHTALFSTAVALRASRGPAPGGGLAGRWLVFAAVLLWVALADPARADTLPAPRGEIVLTISGSIGRTNTEGRAEFDLAMLRGLGVTRITTNTIWTDGASSYEGVPLSAVLRAVEATGALVTATALNDYSVTFPVAEVETSAPIIAFLRDGLPMSVRDKGPLWVIYPYDDSPAYRTEMVYARSIWQLDRLRLHD